jgi:hypothetical protein
MKNNQVLTVEKLCNSNEFNKNNIIEASLLLNFNGRATHFISAKKSLIFDEGIDGKLIKWKKEDFIKHYKNSQWIIDQVVPI